MDNVTAGQAATTSRWNTTTATAFTTTWASSGSQPAIGNGALTGKFYRIGKHVHFQILLTAGSTTNFGTGSWTFSAPSTMSMEGTIRAFATDANTSLPYQGIADSAGSTTDIAFLSEAVSSYWQSTVPVTWATGDKLRITGCTSKLSRVKEKDGKTSPE